MKKLVVSSLLFLLGANLANAEVIPFDSEQWELNPAAKVTEHLGQTALKLGEKQGKAPVALGVATVKDMEFTNGVIEYDVAFGQTRTFAGVKFHIQSHKDYEKFYMRAHQSGNPDANQYMPIYNGVQSWQLYYGDAYATPTPYDFEQWMHVKIVVADKLADIYIKDMEQPALTVDLKREETTGTVGLWGLNISGPAYFANFDVTPMDKAPEIKGTPKPEKAAEAGTVINWQVSNAISGKALADKAQLAEADTKALEFTAIKAEKTGLLNLARASAWSKETDTVFAKVTLNAKQASSQAMEFGFSDSAKVYLNGKLLFTGNDPYNSRDYRFLGTVGFYDNLQLELQEGENEILIAVTESKMVNGWGVQARFGTMADGVVVVE